MRYKKLYIYILIVLSFLCVAAGTKEVKEYAFFASSYEEAREIAVSQGGELVSFCQGIGVIRKMDYPKNSTTEVNKVVLYPDEVFTVDIVNETKTESEQWHLEVLEAEEVWENSTGAGITVAIVDSGVDSFHEDLKEGIVYIDSVIPDSEYGVGQRFDGAYKGPEDYFGHGTHVAGIIGARKNGIGCTGIAPDCKIISIKALEKQGSTGKGKTSWVASAIRLAVEQGADVINLSLGGSSVKNELLYTVIKEAVDKGIAVVCAAGNITGTQMVFYPGAYEETIAVSALKASGAGVTFASSYSNYGEWIDISAPGSSIVSTVPGGYGTKSGTSMACPMVTGGIALLLQEDKGLTTEEICSLLYSSASDLGDTGKDAWYGYGALNLKQLFEKYRENYRSVEPILVYEDSSKIRRGAAIPMELPKEAEKIVYTTDGTIPTTTGNEFPAGGLIVADEAEKVIINARCILGDGALGKNLTVTYFFVDGESNLGKKGNKKESFADYGNDREDGTGYYYRSYRLKLEKGKELNFAIKELNFAAEVCLYDSLEKENLLAKGKVQEDGSVKLKWKNTGEKTKELYLVVKVIEEIEKPGELSYQIQWTCEEENLQANEENPQTSEENYDDTQGENEPTFSKNEAAEIIKEKDIEKKSGENIESEANAISGERVYEEDWLYTMETQETSAENKVGEEESGKTQVISQAEEQEPVAEDQTKEHKEEKNWTITKKCIVFIVCFGILAEIIVVLWYLHKKKKEDGKKSKE